MRGSGQQRASSSLAGGWRWSGLQKQTQMYGIGEGAEAVPDRFGGAPQPGGQTRTAACCFMEAPSTHHNHQPPAAAQPCSTHSRGGGRPGPGNPWRSIGLQQGRGGPGQRLVNGSTASSGGLQRQHTHAPATDSRSKGGGSGGSTGGMLLVAAAAAGLRGPSSQRQHDSGPT